MLVRNPRARRYLLRLHGEGVARVTIPRSGSAAFARQFAERNTAWLEQQIQQQVARPVRDRRWLAGTEILFRGESVRLEVGANGASAQVRFGDQTVPVHNSGDDLRPAIERHLWRLAARELPTRVIELAALHGSSVRRIIIRNQRSRWGSCSRRGTISLNWRLIQTPPFVRDYLILHELMHLREMNHSARFWREVERVCPNFEDAERWLSQDSKLKLFLRL